MLAKSYRDKKSRRRCIRISKTNKVGWFTVYIRNGSCEIKKPIIFSNRRLVTMEPWGGIFFKNYIFNLWPRFEEKVSTVGTKRAIFSVWKILFSNSLKKKKKMTRCAIEIFFFTNYNCYPPVRCNPSQRKVKIVKSDNFFPNIVSPYKYWINNWG